MHYSCSFVFVFTRQTHQLIDQLHKFSFFNYLAKIWKVESWSNPLRSQSLIPDSMTKGSHSFRASHLQWILKLSSGVAAAEETSVSLRHGSRHADRGTLPPIKINAFAAFLVTVPTCAASRQIPLSFHLPSSSFLLAHLSLFLYLSLFSSTCLYFLSCANDDRIDRS